MALATPVAAALVAAFDDGAPVHLQTRPEDIEILPNGELLPYQMIATVDQVAYLGESFEYHVRASGVPVRSNRWEKTPLSGRRYRFAWRSTHPESIFAQRD